MSSLNERLSRLYGTSTKNNEESNSWIPKRLSNDPYRSLKKKLNPDTTLSAKRSQDLLENQENLNDSRAETFDFVALYLLNTFGEKDIEKKLKNFETSWNELFEKYGLDMVEALEELIGEKTIVSHEGFIRKAILREKIKEVEKRR